VNYSHQYLCVSHNVYRFDIRLNICVIFLAIAVEFFYFELLCV